MTVQEIEASLADACAWIENQEKLILKQGVPLNDRQLSDARQIGVVKPERVRLLPVKEMPRENLPSNLIWFVNPDAYGLTARYGIFIRIDLIVNARLIAHELVHTKQYERLGGIEAFLRKYLIECCVSPGYDNSEMEREATTISEQMYP